MFRENHRATHALSVTSSCKRGEPLSRPSGPCDRPRARLCGFRSPRVGCCLALLACAALHAAEPAGTKPASELLGLRLLFSDDFESFKADRWEQSDPRAWKIEERDKNHFYRQFQHVETKTRVRSPV